MTTRGLAGAALLAGLGWLALLALVMRLAGAPLALVPWPPDGFLLRLPPGVTVTDAGTLGLVVRGGDGLVAALYAAGARVVLPAGLAGCLGLAGSGAAGGNI